MPANFIILFLLIAFPCKSQSSQEWTALGNFSVKNYSHNRIDSDFRERFPDPESTTFIMLREYLWEKQEIEYLLKQALHELSRQPQANKDKIEESLRYLSSLPPPQGKQASSDIGVLIDIHWPRIRINGLYSRDSILQSMVPMLRKRLQETIASDSLRDSAADMLLANLRTVQQDITSCEYELSRQLSTEYREQKFRTQISIAFTLLIALLLTTFFLIIFLRSDLRLPAILLGGTGLQFLSLFVLIIAIILFGILNILEGRELAAILSGISGYILGKGISPENKNTSEEPPQTPPLNIQN